MGDPARRAGADADDELFCPECHYNLHGIDSARCPECGADADREGLRAVQLPWAHRRRIGRFRAYVKTWWMATFRIRRLAGEMEHPVGWRDSLRFRWVTVAVATVPVMAALALGGLSLDNGSSGAAFDLADAMMRSVADAESWRYLLGAVGSWAVSAVAATLLLVMATGVAGWFLHPAALPVKQQNRAVALGNYLCAPMALWVPGFFVTPLQIWLEVYPTGGRLSEWLPGFIIVALRGVILCAALAAACAPFVLVPLNTMVLMRLATGAGVRRTLVAGVLLILSWPVLAVLCFAGLHIVTTFVVLVIRHSVP